MSAFVILSLALAVCATGMVVVGTVVLWRAAKDLRAEAVRMGERLGPLSEELSAEMAVTTLELDALQRREGRQQVGDTGSGRT